MSRPFGIVILVSSLVLNLSFLAGYAYQRASAGPEFIEDRLDLTPEQRAQVTGLRDRFLLQAGRIGGEMGELHGRLIDALAAEPRDEAAVEAALERIRQRQREMQQLVVDHLTAEGKLLTMEQRAALYAGLKERMRAQAYGPRWLSGGREWRR